VNPLRVAVFATRFPRASDTPFTNILTGLVQRGHLVDVFADEPEAGTQPHPTIAACGLDRRVFYPAARKPGLAGLTAALRVIRRHRGAWWLWRGFSPWQFGGRGLRGEGVRLAESFVGRGPYDAAYAVDGVLGRQALRLRSTGAYDAPILVSYRGSDATDYPAQRPGVYARLFREAALHLPVCQAYASRLRSMGAPSERVRVHGTGLDVREFAWRAHRAAADDGTLRLVSVARLVPAKGLDVALQAVHQLRASGLDVRYDIIGRGKALDALQQLAAELALGPAVTFHGHQPSARVRDIVSGSDILLTPSVTTPSGRQEGIPNVLKEAMLLGLPVVATRHSGIPELVSDGSTGYLVPERDSAALAAALARLVAERARWPEMGRAGRRVVERDYDIEVLNDRFVALLEEARARHHRPR